MDCEPSAAQSGATTTHIPHLIHQTWITRDGELPWWLERSQHSWVSKNAAYEYRLWTDDEARAFLLERYPQFKPYLQDAQASSAKATPVLSLQLSGVEVADVFRYAVLHAQGGYYADGDVMCMSPISSWPRESGLAAGQGLNATAWVGLEAEFKNDTERRRFKFARRKQFLQWTMGFAPGHPVLARALAIILSKLQRLAASSAGAAGAPSGSGWQRTLELTGPGVFTDAVQRFLRDCNATPASVGAQASVPSPSPHAWSAARMVVLPPRAFACCSHAEHVPSRPGDGTLVMHHYIGSWKKDKKDKKDTK